LIIAQIGLSLALMVVSGLFSKSLYSLSHTDIGMKIDHVVTFSVSPSRNGYTTQRSAQFFESLETELAALAGVESVTSSLMRLISSNFYDARVSVEGYPTAPLGNPFVAFNKGGLNYLKTLGIPLIAGRDFTREDTLGLNKVVIVNEAFAEKYNLGRDVIGKRIGINRSLLDIEPNVEIIGLVKNTKYQSDSYFPPLVTVPFQRSDTIETRTFYIKTALPPEKLLLQMRPLVARLDSMLPIDNLSTMARHVYDETFPNRLITILVVTFAFIATLLTAVGLYGIFAYNVARRRREIGLRMALGATRVRLCLMFLRRAAQITLVGGAIGFALSLFAGRLIQSLLYKFEGFDVGVFIGAAALFFVIMTLAVLIPVCRAVLVEPLEALRPG
jgi:predicted permease